MVVHPPFLQRAGKRLKSKGMRFALLQRSAKDAPFAAQRKQEREVREWSVGKLEVQPGGGT